MKAPKIALERVSEESLVLAVLAVGYPDSSSRSPRQLYQTWQKIQQELDP